MYRSTKVSQDLLSQAFNVGDIRTMLAIISCPYRTPNLKASIPIRKTKSQNTNYALPHLIRIWGDLGLLKLQQGAKLTSQVAAKQQAPKA
jgi:hypothetical protein